MPTTSPMTRWERFSFPSEAIRSTVLLYLHSIATGDAATRGGFTLRDGTISMPTASGSLISGGNSPDDAFITSRKFHVARLNVNSPVNSALVWEFFFGALENISQGGWPEIILKKL